MRILQTETPKEVRDFPAKEELNPTDVVEIFQTPLTGSYNWDYTVQDNRIKKLYELGRHAALEQLAKIQQIIKKSL